MSPVFRILAIVLLVMLLAGWWLASPGGAGQTLDHDVHVALPEVAGPGSEQGIDQALQTLYQRNAWSAVPPGGFAGQGDDASEAEQPAVPEGLERFGLVGIIRVQGQPPEALLIDADAGANTSTDTHENLSSSFSALAGEQLRDTQVRLERIENSRVRLTLGEESRWLSLFVRSEPEPDLDVDLDLNPNPAPNQAADTPSE